MLRSSPTASRCIRGMPKVGRSSSPCRARPTSARPTTRVPTMAPRISRHQYLLSAAAAVAVGGKRGQVTQEAGEAGGGLVVGGGLGRGLVVGCVGALGGGDGVEGVGPVFVGERQRRPGLA